MNTDQVILHGVLPGAVLPPSDTSRKPVFLSVDLATARRIQGENGAFFQDLGHKHLQSSFTAGSKADKFSRDMTIWLAMGIRTADLFWWSHELDHILFESAKTLPEVTLQPDILPSPNGFLVFERSWLATDPGDATRSGWVRAIAWSYEPKTNLIGFCLLVDNPITWPRLMIFSSSCSLVGMQTRYQQAVRLNDDGTPDESTLDSTSDYAAVPVSALLFMGQKFVDVSQQRANRASRKEFPNRANALINVVTLRKRAADSHSATARDVDWSCRWFVSPHWRNQAYGPGHSERRPILIPSYVKGPSDRPLKPPKDRIFKVAR